MIRVHRTRLRFRDAILLEELPARTDFQLMKKEDFKRLGLWNGSAYPTGAHIKIRWLSQSSPTLIPVILENEKSRGKGWTVETTA